MYMMDKLRSLLELSFFGVCSYWGEKLSMPSKSIKLFFIYASFLTFGSPVIIYLTMAFVLKLKDYINGQRNPVWDI